jgi:acyl-coenzyme A thioesterase PaaI-like protein
VVQTGLDANKISIRRWDSPLLIYFSPLGLRVKAAVAQERTDEEQARVAVASELRRGMHLLVGREPSADGMKVLRTSLRRLFDQLDAAPERLRGTRVWQGPPADGEMFADSIDRPVSGSGNPFSVPMVVQRQGDTAVSIVTLDAGFEGAPGRSHGGFVSAIFDDLFGSLPMLQSKVAFTASLTVNYVAPSPVFEPVVFRGWIDRVEGRKIFVAGEAHHGETLVTTATGLFIDSTEMMASFYGA